MLYHFIDFFLWLLLLLFSLLMFFFFFKQKTAYEMRISDWSSDVCSSDLPVPVSSQSSSNSVLTCVERGTRWAPRIFIFSAGRFQTERSKSNSAHSACRSSPGRTNMWAESRSA